MEQPGFSLSVQVRRELIMGPHLTLARPLFDPGLERKGLGGKISLHTFFLHVSPGLKISLSLNYFKEKFCYGS